MPRSFHCFLIDDDPDDHKIFEVALREVDREIVLSTASNGEDGLLTLRLRPSNPPDFIFLDVNMPRMNGIECLRELRKMETLSNTRIFMYSTSASEEVSKLTRELGAEGFITKPASIARLREILSSIFIHQA